jgi:hypothetical protein
LFPHSAVEVSLRVEQTMLLVAVCSYVAKAENPTILVSRLLCNFY